MSLRRLLGPLVIVAVLVFAGALQPLLDKARADTINISGGQDPGPTAIQTRVQTVIGQGKRTWVPNQQSVTALTPFLGTPYGGPISTRSSPFYKERQIFTVNVGA